MLQIRDVSPGDSGWCVPEALYAIMDATGNIVFLLHGDYELMPDDTDHDPETKGGLLRVSKTLKEDEISGINPRTRRRVSLGGLTVDASTLSKERSVPCFSEAYRETGDVIVDAMIEPPELAWGE